MKLSLQGQLEPMVLQQAPLPKEDVLKILAYLKTRSREVRQEDFFSFGENQEEI